LSLFFSSFFSQSLSFFPMFFTQNFSSFSSSPLSSSLPFFLSCVSPSGVFIRGKGEGGRGGALPYPVIAQGERELPYPYPIMGTG
jgi:hypothetical protein